MAKVILIAEDVQMQREALATMLTEEGYEVLQAGNGKEAYDLVLDRPVDVIISDVRMPEMDGMVLLKHIQKLAPETPMIMVTAYGSIQSTVAAMRLGAVDYLVKPVQFQELLLKVQRALDRREMRHARQVITERLSATSSFHNLVGQSQSMQQLFQMVRKLSKVKSNVLITGESGTGKDLFAQAIHCNGVTRDKPFVPVNCGGISKGLVESELFGYRQGAFTGALRDKVGYFEAADGGTLFLDEIASFPLAAQGSLLRALEEKLIVPVGDTHPRPVDVRIVAASNRDLRGMVAHGEFRLDLLHRLNVVTIHLPALRDRREDIPLLVEHFVEKHARAMDKPIQGVSSGAMRALLTNDWPGNVRELENAIERAMIFAEGDRIALQDIPLATEGMSDHVSEGLREALLQFERQHILDSLRRHNYRKVEVAKSLGISLSSIYRKLDDLHIPRDVGDADTGMGLQQ